MRALVFKNILTSGGIDWRITFPCNPRLGILLLLWFFLRILVGFFAHIYLSIHLDKEAQSHQMSPF